MGRVHGGPLSQAGGEPVLLWTILPGGGQLCPSGSAGSASVSPTQIWRRHGICPRGKEDSLRQWPCLLDLLEQRGAMKVMWPICEMGQEQGSPW